jgi:hypothetical protein
MKIKNKQCGQCDAKQGLQQKKNNDILRKQGLPQTNCEKNNGL